MHVTDRILPIAGHAQLLCRQWQDLGQQGIVRISVAHQIDEIAWDTQRKSRRRKVCVWQRCRIQAQQVEQLGRVGHRGGQITLPGL